MSDVPKVIHRMKVETLWCDGLEFTVPTWDPTPVAWNDKGSWAKDPALEERLRGEIRKAVPNHEALTRQALTATGENTCQTFWGSHGCYLTEGHVGLCVCGATGDLCSAGLKYGDSDTLILWWSYVDETDFTLSTHHWRWYT